MQTQIVCDKCFTKRLHRILTLRVCVIIMADWLSIGLRCALFALFGIELSQKSPTWLFGCYLPNKFPSSDPYRPEKKRDAIQDLRHWWTVFVILLSFPQLADLSPMGLGRNPPQDEGIFRPSFCGGVSFLLFLFVVNCWQPRWGRSKGHREKVSNV